jgi:hypothetical protein
MPSGLAAVPHGPHVVEVVRILEMVLVEVVLVPAEVALIPLELALIPLEVVRESGPGMLSMALEELALNLAAEDRVEALLPRCREGGHRPGE